MQRLGLAEASLVDWAITGSLFWYTFHKLRIEGSAYEGTHHTGLIHLHPLPTQQKYDKAEGPYRKRQDEPAEHSWNFSVMKV